MRPGLKLFSLILFLAGAAILPIGGWKAWNEVSASQAASARDTLCLEVSDAGTGEPVTTFSVALTRESNDPFRPQFKIPLGYPAPVGELIESFSVHSTEGRYCFSTTPPEDLTIVVGSPGHQFESIRERPDKRRIRVHLQSAPSLEGSVREASGTPVEGAEVRIMKRGDPTPAAGSPRATTDADGRFSGPALHLAPEVEQLEVEIRHPEFLPVQKTVNRSELSSPLLIRLGARLEGGPLLGTLEAAPGLADHVVIEARCGRRKDVAEPAPDGTFRFSFLPYGPCVLRTLVLPGERLIIAPHEWDLVAASSEISINHQGEPRAVSPPRSATVAISASRDETGSLTCTISATGPTGEVRRFGMPYARLVRARLQEGQWTVGGTCQASGTHLDFEPQSTDVREGDERSVSLALLDPFPLSVKVNGRPIGGVELIPLDPSIRTTFSSRDVTETRTIHGLQQGRYNLIVHRTFTRTVELPSPLEADIETHSLTLFLEGNGEDLTYPNIDLSLTSSFGAFHYVQQPRLFHRRENEWWAESLLPGTYELKIEAPGFQTQSVGVTLNEQSTVRARLDPIPLPIARPEATLPIDERSILQTVLRDVHQRVTGAFQESGEPPNVCLLSQTDTPERSATANWQIENDSADLDVEKILERFDLDAGLAAIEIGSLAQDSGFDIVALTGLPIERSRVGRVWTALDLVDEGRLNEGPPWSVLLTVTRPHFSPGRREAVVIVTCRQVDFFNWIYLVHVLDDEVFIQRVAEPKPSC